MSKPKYLRKVIHIGAAHSPNVALGLQQQAAGIEPTGEELLPGVISWDVYNYRIKTWDKIRKIIGIDGHFYEGAAQFLYPAEWRSIAQKRAQELNIQHRRQAKSMGIDTAEGGDKTAWAIADQDGLIKLEAYPTPDTEVICGKTIAFMKEYNIRPEMVLFDRGGGGGVHADRLRAKGYKVRDVAFSEGALPEMVRHMVPFEQKVHDKGEKYMYKNRRVQMYHSLHLRLDPVYSDGKVFSLPDEYTELDRQMAVMPLQYNEEGIMVLPPKSKRDPKDTRITITDMLGCSPDETDAVVLAAFAMDERSMKLTLGAMF